MTLKNTLALGAISSLLFSAAAFAQTPAAAPAAAAPAANMGPVIPGVCTYSSERAIGLSQAGQSIGGRMKQLGAAVQAELGSEGSALQTEQNTLEAQAKTMPRDQLEQKVRAFQEKAGAFEGKRNLRLQELQATEQKQVGLLSKQIDPILQAVYTERGCGLMLDRGAMYGANPAMDVTDLVVQRLNAKVQTVSFDREHLDQQAQAARPAAAAPAAAKPVAAKPVAKKK